MSVAASQRVGANLASSLVCTIRHNVSRHTRPSRNALSYRSIANTTSRWQQIPQQQQQQSTSRATITTATTGSTAPPVASPKPPSPTYQKHQPQPAPTPSQPQAQHAFATTDEPSPRSLTESLADPPPTLGEDERQVDWTRSFHGLSSTPFTPEQSAILMQDIPWDDIEIKPDGIIYLPEIKYRRILNKAFGPGGWGLAPRGETIVTGKVVTREYGLVCGGRLVSVARGEQQYFDPDGIPTATEGCKSNALMRCCKDLGIASELWDPRFIRRFMKEMGKESIVEHVTTKKRRKHFCRKDDEIKYPYKEIPVPAASGGTSSATNTFRKS
ncbi:Mgm101p-domain-containing protein [Polychaeton citri CBS 116435]|uniref:Mitochondrial genome maintenance protein MGM101 n=1 Tax=Polychaeton citri CBS 116435 TaxID=1314669 RepID=A0A9P4QC86_9PEZI|nr:Mgm101p-domain-containing protein [Polychaeton citri CBS 116435]